MAKKPIIKSIYDGHEAELAKKLNRGKEGVKVHTPNPDGYTKTPNGTIVPTNNPLGGNKVISSVNVVDLSYLDNNSAATPPIQDAELASLQRIYDSAANKISKTATKKAERIRAAEEADVENEPEPRPKAAKRPAVRRAALNVTSQPEPIPVPDTSAIFASLGIPNLGPVAAKPTIRVQFDLGALGKQEAWYHWLVENDGCLFLIYDTRFEYGIRYTPPNLGQNQPLKIVLPDYKKKYSVYSLDFTHPFGVFYITNLVILDEPAMAVDTLGGPPRITEIVDLSDVGRANPKFNLPEPDVDTDESWDDYGEKWGN